ncbi:hypothetical protein H2198_006265 [Neophaeococcomyces mojaviensis]|uniref:Uncharacterized protein n=1 Tax=Neophaeococcomyces mojaviensis TaxID=3383035 RepID=A0ACC3A3C5_9EURO|nr:hypothetical protein H2198_006265 [Knufia sp. JES_112]
MEHNSHCRPPTALSTRQSVRIAELERRRQERLRMQLREQEQRCASELKSIKSDLALLKKKHKKLQATCKHLQAELNSRPTFVSATISSTGNNISEAHSPDPTQSEKQRAQGGTASLMEGETTEPASQNGEHYTKVTATVDSFGSNRTRYSPMLSNQGQGEQHSEVIATPDHGISNTMISVETEPEMTEEEKALETSLFRQLFGDKYSSAKESGS